jgi:hypothetical protein
MNRSDYQPVTGNFLRGMVKSPVEFTGNLAFLPKQRVGVWYYCILYFLIIIPPVGGAGGALDGDGVGEDGATTGTTHEYAGESAEASPPVPKRAFTVK